MKVYRRNPESGEMEIVEVNQGATSLLRPSRSMGYVGDTVEPSAITGQGARSLTEANRPTGGYIDREQPSWSPIGAKSLTEGTYGGEYQSGESRIESNLRKQKPVFRNPLKQITTGIGDFIANLDRNITLQDLTDYQKMQLRSNRPQLPIIDAERDAIDDDIIEMVVDEDKSLFGPKLKEWPDPPSPAKEEEVDFSKMTMDEQIKWEWDSYTDKEKADFGTYQDYYDASTHQAGKLHVSVLRRDALKLIRGTNIWSKEVEELINTANQDELIKMIEDINKAYDPQNTPPIY